MKAVPLRTAGYVLASAVCYYAATQVAWALTFPESKVSLFFPPQAVLLCILLVVPTRHWWACVLAAAGAHFLATRQAGWPPLYALTAETFDAVKCVSAAAGIRILIKSPIKAITLRDAILFVLIAVVLVPFGTAFWGASFTISFGFGTRYWVEWRNLGISNAVTTVVLVPALLLGGHHLFVRRSRALPARRVLEAALVGACTVALGFFVFDRTSAGPNTSVKGDSVQLQQVILNLMLNAFSAMDGTGPDGGRRVVVRTKSTGEATVLIEVQDSGTGIAADKLESIFDPFVTSKPDGLGMGLSICRSIIERHGGRISAANNPGRGATFSITLPVSPP